MAKQLVNPEQVKSLGRPIGKMVAANKLSAFIKEAEMLHVKPLLGDELYINLLDAISEETGELTEDADPRFDILLNGGVYDSADYNNKEHSKCMIDGLRIALSYYVYAEYVMIGDFESTRFGNVTSNNNFSTHISRNYRSDLYNNSTDKANAFLDDCLTFCKISGLIKEKGKSKVNIGGCTIRKIG